MARICEDLTTPEDSAERLARRRVLQTITDKGGCAYCVHRDRDVLAWGRSICSADQARSFPRCTTDARSPVFELDQKRLQGDG
jgi:hypothetical protein